MKLNGFRASHRNRWLLIKKGVLNIREFLLFEYYLDSIDFDTRHDNFGEFEAYHEDTAKIFNKEPDTVEDWHNSLLKKGFIKIFDEKRKLFKVKSPERYGTVFGCKAGEFTENEKITPTLGFILNNICFFPEKAEINPPKSISTATKNTSKALGSFKVNLGLSNVVNVSQKVVIIKQEVRSDEEYQKIYADGNFEGLNPDDMRWIDETVVGKIVIENDEQEKEIVRIYFNGDWDEYQKNLVQKTGDF